MLIALFVESFCFGQSDSTFYYFNRYTPEGIIQKKIQNLKPSIEKDYFSLIYHSKLRNKDSMIYYVSKIESKKTLPKKFKAKLLYFKSYYFRINQNDSLSFKYQISALKHAERSLDTLTVLFSLSGLGQSYSYEEDKPYRLDYLKKLETKADYYNNSSYKISAKYLLGNYYLFRDNSKQAIKYYKQVLKKEFTKLDSSKLISTYSNLGVLYNEVLENTDSALYYYDKKLKLIEKNKIFQNNKNYFTTYLNIASAYKNRKEYDKSLYFLKKADSIEIKENVLTRKLTIKESLAQIGEAKGNYKSAYENFKEFYKLNDSLSQRELAEGIAKYENQELKILNLELEAKQARKQTQLLITIGLIIFGSVLFFLIQKNTKKKQKLAEKEKQLESQKLATVLKEQELTAIDAMIEGQEKERQRIANELHDDLGGLMATVKLHFNALKGKNSPELFKKTNLLIDEAYQKIRSVAHTKNSGVIAKHGLLKSVLEMAEKISISSQLDVKVIDHGLETRLENSLELTIFRITQELVSNAVKHAEASEINIYITNHKDSLNLMIEDDGIGFNTSQVISKNKGMGLSSIDKRVEYLEGRFTIESNKNKGTTVIIDIPL